MTAEYKVCSCCGENKELSRENFQLRKNGRWESNCRVCINRIQKEKRRIVKELELKNIPKLVPNIINGIRYMGCIRCGENKPLTNENYYLKKDGKFESCCRKCRRLGQEVSKNRIQRGERSKRYIENIERNGIKFRKCYICGFEKELCLENFYFHSRNNDWKNPCKECSKKLLRDSKKRIKRSLEFILGDIVYKECSDCGLSQELNIKNFMRQSGGWRSQCRHCYMETRHEYEKNNKDKVVDCKQSSYLKHRDRRRAEVNRKNRERRDKIKGTEEFKRKNREYMAKRRQNDMQFKLKCNFSRAISYGLRRVGLVKNRKSILNVLPYTMQELKEYLEKQFEAWMNWNNWSPYNPSTWIDGCKDTYTWNIDHLKPQADFNIKEYGDEEFQKCWALENLRPLSAKQNIQDGARLIRNIKPKLKKPIK